MIQFSQLFKDSALFRTGFILFIQLFFAAQPILSAGLPLASPYEVDGIEYDSRIPDIEKITGIKTGLRHTTSFQLIEYFRAVEATSNRVSLIEYGRTYEGVPLICAAVTSPENQAGLEAIRKKNLRISEDPESINPEDLERMPLVIYIGSGIHGNEASGGKRPCCFFTISPPDRGAKLMKSFPA